ncbi:MAG: Guanylate kinase [Ignavibacteriae bacterium]|nr:MAG: Guanylate kinase [Ignavibacteriota bacterium]
MNNSRTLNNIKLLVISAPSGCGKTTIVQEILKRHPEFYFSISATTRKKREYEIDGKDYYFISKSEFEKMIQQNELIEWQKIYDDYYGTPVSEIKKAEKNGKSIVFDIDVLGALNIKKKFPNDTVTIFIDVPSLEVLVERLKNRKTENEETLRKRLERVEMEMKQKEFFDYIVINDDLSKAVNEVENIINKQIN